MPKKPYTRKPRVGDKDSIRYKLGATGEIWTIPQLRAMLHEAADSLEAAGITHVKPCNLYINPVDAKGQPIVRVRGHALEDHTIASPYRSAADEHGV